jgi:hypothetical protein
VNKPALWMGYSLDGREKVTVTGEVTLAGSSSGLHNVTVYAENEFENIGSSETATFTIAEELEPFSPILVAASSIASASIIAVGLRAYFNKH